MRSAGRCLRLRLHPSRFGSTRVRRPAEEIPETRRVFRAGSNFVNGTCVPCIPPLVEIRRFVDGQRSFPDGCFSFLKGRWNVGETRTATVRSTEKDSLKRNRIFAVEK